MRYEQIPLRVPGQQTGPAALNAYILDAIHVAPHKRRPAVIVVPGGGYNHCSDREREPVAMKFLAMGCHAFTLDYSVALEGAGPGTAGVNRFPTALRELALAVATVREQADEWHVDPSGILVCGFSAGGHLAGNLGTSWKDEDIWGAVKKRPQEIRPDGLILCYPVVTAGRYRHAGSFEALLGPEPQEALLDRVSLERHVTHDMPPVFLWHTLTDQTVPVENSLLLLKALKDAGVSVEFHLYPTGNHGLALASEETAGREERYLEPVCQSWISLAGSWICHSIQKERPVAVPGITSDF
ncbi:MAG: alpha/beta hydrolase [Clostridiales bacterium]|nr:alpha/beta hydrolase [Clostridiales bacterium]